MSKAAVSTVEARVMGLLEEEQPHLAKLLKRKIVCPYCDKELEPESNACCGEANHGVLSEEEEHA